MTLSALKLSHSNYTHMSDDKKIERVVIAKIGRKEMPSKFREGETYTMTNIQTEDGRVMTTFTDWAKTWKVGDAIEGIITSSTYKNKQGFDEESIRIADPSLADKKKGAWSGGARAGGVPRIVDAYKIAAQLAPVLYAGKTGVKLDDISALANEIKKRIDAGAGTPSAPAAPVAKPAPQEVKTVDVAIEESAIEGVELEDDDSKPF